MALRMNQIKGCSRAPFVSATRPLARQARSSVAVRVAGEYPDADLITATRENFPEKVRAKIHEDNEVKGLLACHY